MTLSDKMAYYADLLIAQYRTGAKARAQVAITGKQIVADDLSDSLQTAFDLDTAVGAQLDIIGKYVGVNRNIGVASAAAYFGFWTYNSALLQANYQGTWDPTTDSPALPSAVGIAGQWYAVSTSGASTSPITANWLAGNTIFSDGTNWIRSTTDNANGFITYGDTTTNRNTIWLSYAAASRANTALPDATYRTIIRLKIILNSSDGTLASIVTALVETFPGLITVVDTADMHLAYTVVSTLGLSPELLLKFLPKPMGVGISVTIVEPPTPGGDHLTTESGDILTTEDGSPLLT